ncbi:ATP-binding protein [Priestia megaterium]
MHLIAYVLTFIENITLLSFLVKLLFGNLVKNIRKVIMFSTIYSLCTSYTFNWDINTDIKLLVNIFMHIIIVMYIFKLSLQFSILISLLRAVLQTTLESIIVLIILNAQYIDFVKMKLPLQIYIAIFLYITIIIGIIVLSKKDISLKKVLDRNNLNSNFIITIITSILAQIFVVLLAVLVDMGNGEGRRALTYIIVFATILIMCNLIRVVVKFCEKSEQQMYLMSEDVYLSNLQDLSTTVKSHRHDYYNQLQVIYGLSEHKQYNELNQYIKNLFQDICLTDNLLRLKHTALSTLLQAKIEVAKLYNINFFIDTAEDIPCVKILSHELIQIVGNIVDNAFEAELASKKEDKYVSLKIDHLLKSFLVIEVNNQNSYIKGDNLDKVFVPGYSTKLNHQGIGLYTVKRKLEKYNGYIELTSEKEVGTTFRVFIPTLVNKKF